MKAALSRQVGAAVADAIEEISSGGLPDQGGSDGVTMADALERALARQGLKIVESHYDEDKDLSGDTVEDLVDWIRQH